MYHRWSADNPWRGSYRDFPMHLVQPNYSLNAAGQRILGTRTKASGSFDSLLKVAWNTTNVSLRPLLKGNPEASSPSLSRYFICGCEERWVWQRRPCREKIPQRQLRQSDAHVKGTVLEVAWSPTPIGERCR